MGAQHEQNGCPLQFFKKIHLLSIIFSNTEESKRLLITSSFRLSVMNCRSPDIHAAYLNSWYPCYKKARSQASGHLFPFGVSKNDLEGSLMDRPVNLLLSLCLVHLPIQKAALPDQSLVVSPAACASASASAKRLNANLKHGHGTRTSKNHVLLPRKGEIVSSMTTTINAQTTGELYTWSRVSRLRGLGQTPLLPYLRCKCFCPM